MKLRPAVTLFIVLLLSPGAWATPSMAFGYLTNKSGDDNYDYLETIFPNSFANSIKNIFDVDVVKPLQVNEQLQKYKNELKKDYAFYELPELVDQIDSDLFIYGTFTPLENDQIRIVLNLYTRGSNRIFRFTNVGKMETEIFRLVDRITSILIDFMSDQNLYITRTVAPGARIAILSNLSGTELNSLYYPFMEKGYKLSYMQGNTLETIVTDEKIDLFRNIYTDENSYEIITDQRQVKFLFGSWAGDNYIREVNAFRDTYTRYDFHFDKTKKETLARLSRSFNNTIDFILVTGFNDSRDKAWVRCIDLRKQDLIWMQTGISAGSIDEITRLMIERLNTSQQALFEVKK